MVYWKSLEEKLIKEQNVTKEAVDTEFMSSPFASEDGDDGASRRDFLKLMGASLALASTACIRKPVDYIVPYASQPPEITPGVANYYASSWVHQGEYYGFKVKTREGRPIKLEGNPNSVNKRALSAHAQAQTLSLYDPDRLKSPMKRNEDGSFSKITWDDVDSAVTAELKKGEVVLLSSSLGSPTTSQIISDFFQGFKGRHVQWDVLGADDVMEGQKLSYGNYVLPRYKFDQAKMVVSIDADFLGTWLSPTEFSSLFSKNRKPSQDMSKLVVFESMLSLTGANADTRIQITPSQQLTAVMAILYELIINKKVSRYTSDSQVVRTLMQFGNATTLLGVEKDLIEAIASDLWKNRGQSLVVAGGITTRTSRSLDLQVAVNFLNTVLENEGKTVDGASVPVTSFEGSYKQMQDLINDMNSGKVQTLVIYKTNPAYSLPDNSQFVEALKKVKLVVYTGSHLDETAKLSHIIAPDHHHLENWGDNEVQKGVYSIQQPTIRPLYDTRSLELSLISWAYQLEKGPQRLQSPDTWLQYLRESWKSRKAQVGIGGDFDSFWVNFLKEGILDLSSRSGKRNSNTERKFLVNSFTNIDATKSSGDIELQLYSKIGHLDGSFANNAWLMELPDPITKIVWDNYFCVSPQLASELKLKEGQVLEVKVGNQTLSAPTHIQPGVHPKVVALAVGYGRTEAGSVGSNIGVNAFKFVQFRNQPIYSGQSAALNVTKEKIELACTQDHHSMEGRQIIVQATLKDYLKDPGSNIHRHKIITLWPKHEFKGYRWAMTVDQSLCTGCSACVTACQSENNIPTVGKKFVLQGREMHWIRIDRYYSGNENNPETLFQPMLCQHCENAPCETVCPVLATTRDDEGLNQMTYNRCVGTRYCANNCPYKVRRFNWFNYAVGQKKPQTLALNPDVTVRTRGVMEKCTFCTQRLHTAKNTAKDQGTVVKDGDVLTACQEACPTGAIIFGNINDPDSQVAKEFKSPRSYAVLEEWHAVPMIHYQTKVRNADTIVGDSKGGHS